MKKSSSLIPVVLEQYNGTPNWKYREHHYNLSKISILLLFLKYHIFAGIRMHFFYRFYCQNIENYLFAKLLVRRCDFKTLPSFHCTIFTVEEWGKLTDAYSCFGCFERQPKNRSEYIRIWKMFVNISSCIINIFYKNDIFKTPSFCFSCWNLISPSWAYLGFIISPLGI